MNFNVGVIIEVIQDTPWHPKNGAEVLIKAGERGQITKYEYRGSVGVYMIKMESGVEVVCSERSMTTHFKWPNPKQVAWSVGERVKIRYHVESKYIGKRGKIASGASGGFFIDLDAEMTAIGLRKAGETIVVGSLDADQWLEHETPIIEPGKIAVPASLKTWAKQVRKYTG